MTNCSKIDDDIEYVSLNTSELDVNGKYIKSTPSDPINNEIKEFGQIDTKATVVPIWKEGDMLCVYSLDENNKIIFKDTCTVYNIRNNVAKIKAEVAKSSYRYFASYPYDHIIGNVGEVLDDTQEGYINHTGIFGDESVMMSYCNKNGNTFNFVNRYSLFYLEDIKSNNFPLTITFYKQDGSTIVRKYDSFSGNDFYSAIWYQEFISPQFDLEYQNNGKTTKVTKYPNQTIKTRHIYPYSLNNFHPWW